MMLESVQNACAQIRNHLQWKRTALAQYELRPHSGARLLHLLPDLSSHERRMGMEEEHQDAFIIILWAT